MPFCLCAFLRISDQDSHTLTWTDRHWDLSSKGLTLLTVGLVSFICLDVLTNACMVSAKDFLFPLTLGGALRSTIATTSIVKKSIVSKNNEFGGFSNLETVTQSSVMPVSLL